jgi:hypothetical protein
VIQRRLPYRLPEATFQKIRWYLHHPANLTEPDEGEAVDIPEAEAFDQTLSKEQLQFVTAAINQENMKMRADMGESGVSVGSKAKAFVPPGTKKKDDLGEKVKKMAGEMTAGEIAEELGLALPVVMAMLGGEG